ncbi:SET domain-containing protein 5 [Taxawa tesnikishii (nom. ined.)]|nr:SET domain-containing protein 5 [Dothideales sp. JES 119]
MAADASFKAEVEAQMKEIEKLYGKGMIEALAEALNALPTTTPESVAAYFQSIGYDPRKAKKNQRKYQKKKNKKRGQQAIGSASGKGTVIEPLSESDLDSDDDGGDDEDHDEDHDPYEDTNTHSDNANNTVPKSGPANGDSTAPTTETTTDSPSRTETDSESGSDTWGFDDWAQRFRRNNPLWCQPEELASTNPDFYTIRKTPHFEMGYGVFAVSDIKRGTRIMEDREVQRGSKEIWDMLWFDAEHFERYMDVLHRFHEDSQYKPENETDINIKMRATNIALMGDLDRRAALTDEKRMEMVQDHFGIFAIFESNAMWIDRREAFGKAVFEQASRINHSCHPNAIHSWNKLTYIQSVHALRDIKAGEQIFIDYVPDSMWDPDQRAKWLQYYHNFTCRCPSCAGPSAVQSRANRAEMQKLYQKLWDHLDKECKEKKNIHPPKDLMQSIWSQILLQKKEGLVNIDMANILNYYAQFTAERNGIDASSKVLDVKQKAYSIYATVYGLDHPFVRQKMEELKMLWEFRYDTFKMQSIMVRFSKPAILDAAEAKGKGDRISGLRQPCRWSAFKS